MLRPVLLAMEVVSVAVIADVALLVAVAFVASVLLGGTKEVVVNTDTVVLA